MKHGGHLVNQLRRGGHIVSQLRRGGHVVTQMKRGGHVVNPLRLGGYVVNQLRRGWYESRVRGIKNMVSSSCCLDTGAPREEKEACLQTKPNQIKTSRLKNVNVSEFLYDFWSYECEKIESQVVTSRVYSYTYMSLFKLLVWYGIRVF